MPITPPLTDLADELRSAGRVLSRAGLVTAFGHVSIRVDERRMLITPPVPLARVGSDRCVLHEIDAEELPAGAPKEAWLHVAILRTRQDVGAVCRAQPEIATAMAAAALGIPALTGHAVLAGAPVPVAPDARLVRDHDSARRVVTTLGSGSAVLLPGNGAVTVGATVGQAVARMWLLERAAQVTAAAAAAAAGPVDRLSDEDADSWRATAPELLDRVWTYLNDPEENR